MNLSTLTDAVKAYAPRLIARLKLDRRLHALCGSPLSILMYHGVVPAGTRPGLWTQIERPDFEDQMRFLADHRPVVPLQSLIEGLAGRQPLPTGAVAITFDDGYFNVLEHALPVLEKYRLPATLFVTAGLVGTDALLWTDQVYDRLLSGAGADDFATDQVYTTVKWLKAQPDLERRQHLELLLEPYGGAPRVDRGHPRRMLDEDELRELASSPLFTIGAHSMTHPLLTRVAPQVADDEIRRSRSRLEALLERPVRLFAYPDGAHNDQTVQLVRDAGFDAALTTRLSRVRPGDDLFRLGRYPVGRGMSRERFALLMTGIDELLAPLRGWS
jgi:peptidoglycan/xylan/chitin deacetylase (PgdA/CDA1 family)